MVFHQNTVLTKASDLEMSNIVLDTPSQGTIPGQKLTFMRVSIGVKNSDGSVGELIIPTPTVFSFGIQENVDEKTGTLTGYVMPLSLWSRNGATSREKIFVECFDNVVEQCKKLIFSIKDQIGQHDMVESDLRKLKGLYRKKNVITGKADVDSPPYLYCRLMFSKKNNEITTDFHTPKGETLHPKDIMQKWCNVKACIKFESFFIIGDKISIQIKMSEASIALLSTPTKRLLDADSEDEDEKKLLEISEAPTPPESDSESDEDAVVPVKKAPVKRAPKKSK